MARWLDPPVTGTWPVRGLPDRVLLSGRWFRRSRWGRPAAGVVAHYREEQPTNAAHAFVGSGRWSVTHIDNFNPDAGPWQAIQHLLWDYLPSLARAPMVARP